MQKIPLSQKVGEMLKEHPNKKFTAREIAEQITKIYAEDYKEKRANPKFKTDKDFIQQIASEIGVQKKLILKKSLHIFCISKPLPRLFWYDPDNVNNGVTFKESKTIKHDDKPVSISKNMSEHALYPLLIDYLKTKQGLFCKRIDEKRSKNSYGSGGNQWLHPDIVAIKPVDKNWDNQIKKCVRYGSSGQRVSIQSFEVKKELNISNVRQNFFQAVSNSSWANEGYLVAVSINNKVEQELRMLSTLHGIGVIRLNPENTRESKIFLPAKAKTEVDWQSVNRIVKENEDFKDFIDRVSMYYQTGDIIPSDWNKI